MGGSAEQVGVDSLAEEMLARVAAIDVGKDAGVVCLRTPQVSQQGKRVSAVWTVSSRTRAILELADRLADEGVERVVLEATSDYWRPFCYLLEARGVPVWLVNARDVKNVPSFVPPSEIRQLPDYTRQRSDLIGDRSQQVQRLEKLLEDALIKLSSVATNIMGVSCRLMLDALIAGERNPQVLAELARGRLRVKRAALIEALTGRFDEHHAELVDLRLGQIDALSAQIERLDERIEQLIGDLPAAHAPADPGGAAAPGTPPRYLAAVDRLDEITGIGRHAAQTIIAELGLSMTIFRTAAHLVSWAKVRPRAIQSGARTRRGKTGKGDSYLKAVLGEAAVSAARTNTFLGVTLEPVAA